MSYGIKGKTFRVNLSNGNIKEKEFSRKYFLQCIRGHGVGARGFYEWMSVASCPQTVIERFIENGYSIAPSKAWLFS